MVVLLLHPPFGRYKHAGSADFTRPDHPFRKQVWLLLGGVSTETGKEDEGHVQRYFPWLNNAAKCDYIAI